MHVLQSCTISIRRVVAFYPSSLALKSISEETIFPGMLHFSLLSAAIRSKIQLWDNAARSPDLNPIERFWAWLRKALLHMDMADLKAGRAVPGKTAYKERVRRLLKTARAQKAAANHAKSWRKTCQIVVKRKGGASGK